MIGPHSYLAPGLGLAGGNLERDLATVLRLAQAHGTDGGIVTAWLANSRHRREWTWRMLEATGVGGRTDAAIAIWGLAYKENTHSTKNSPALALLKRLPSGAIAVYDPVVPADAAGPKVKAATSALAASEGADALCIMTPWPEFKAIAPCEIAARMRGRVVLDPYRVLDPAAAQAAGLRYTTLGTAPMDQVPAC